MVYGVCRDRLHEKKPFWNHLPVQTLLYLNSFYCYDVHLLRTANFFFSINVRLDTQRLSRIKQNQLRNRLSLAAWIYFAFCKPFLLRGSMPALTIKIDPEQASTTRIPGFVNFCPITFIRAVFFCTRRIKSLNAASNLLLLCTRFSCGSLGRVGIRLVYAGCVVITSPGAT